MELRNVCIGGSADLRIWSLGELPWPAFGGYASISTESVRAFLLHETRPGTQGVSPRSILRRVSLRWHTDKLRRILSLVRFEEQSQVEELARRIVVIVNSTTEDLEV